MPDKDFILAKSFNIDNGELDNLTPQTCFVLGYELARIDEWLILKEDGFALPVHSENRSRLERSIKSANRPFSITFMSDDSSESWLWLEVSPKL